MLENIPIRHKLLLIIMSASIAGLLLAGSAFIAYDRFQVKRAMVQEFSVLAKLIAGRSTAAISFDDTAQATENLSALSAKPSIRKACIFGPAGDLFAGWLRTPRERGSWPSAAPERPAHHFRADGFEMFFPVFLDGSRIGAVYIQSDLMELNGRLRDQLLVSAVIVFLAFIFAFMVSYRLQAVVSEPVTKLARTARKVAEESDYSIRAEKKAGDDELGRLVDAFNDMLSQIQRRDEDLRENEREFRQLVESSPVAIAITDLSDNIHLFNRKFIEVFGYTLADLPTVEAWWPRAYPDAEYRQEVMDKWQAGIERAKATGREIDPLEATVRCQDGSDRHVLFRASVIGERLIIIMDDLSERKRMEEERKKLEYRLGQAQKMEAIGTLAGGIAHDFNNILSAILGYSEMAMADLPMASPVAGSLDEVLKAGHRASDLVKQILAFSRQAPRDLKPVRLDPILQEALNLLRASIPTTIEFRQDIGRDCGTVMADPTQIHQVLMNLCTNAYHAMREGGGVLTVSLSAAVVEKGDNSVPGLGVPAGAYVKLTVSDTGHGMAKAVTDRIFEPFFTTKVKGEGTGMGLSVIHGIVKDHRGHITVDSEPEKGSAFQIYFPRVDETQALSDGYRDLPVPGGEERILLVDDEEVIVRLEEQFLYRIGYAVTAVTDCEEALTIFRTRPHDFDLVITDMTMPKITGAQLTRELLAVRKDIPIILCTGFSELINEAEAKSIGIREYLMKPVINRTLALAIRKVLDETGAV